MNNNLECIKEINFIENTVNVKNNDEINQENINLITSSTAIVE